MAGLLLEEHSKAFKNYIPYLLKIVVAECQFSSRVILQLYIHVRLFRQFIIYLRAHQESLEWYPRYGRDDIARKMISDNLNPRTKRGLMKFHGQHSHAYSTVHTS